MRHRVQSLELELHHHSVYSEGVPGFARELRHPPRILGLEDVLHLHGLDDR